MVLGWGFPTVNGSIPSNCRTWHCAHSHMAWIVRIQAGQESWGFPPLHSPTYLSCMPSQSHIIFRLECQIVQVSRRRVMLCNGDDCLMLWPLWAATSSPVHATVLSLNCINHILHKFDFFHLRIFISFLFTQCYFGAWIHYNFKILLLF